MEALNVTYSYWNMNDGNRIFSKGKLLNSEQDNLLTMHTVKRIALAGVAQWIDSRPANQKVASLIPSQGTCLGWGPGPQWGCVRGNHTLMFLSLPFSLPSSLSQNK